jgi:hypothetical protein
MLVDMRRGSGTEGCSWVRGDDAKHFAAQQLEPKGV